VRHDFHLVKLTRTHPPTRRADSPVPDRLEALFQRSASAACRHSRGLMSTPWRIYWMEKEGICNAYNDGAGGEHGFLVFGKGG
jgi:hypothetical protein